MSFGHPLLLLTLLVLPLAVAVYFWLDRRRAKYAMTFTNMDVLASVMVGLQNLREGRGMGTYPQADPFFRDFLGKNIHVLMDLRQQLGLTVIMITHDLDTIFRTCNRVGVIIDRKMTSDTLEGITRNPHPWIQAYFHGERAQRFGQGKAQ